MTEQIITVRGSEQASLEAHITAREGLGVRVTYWMKGRDYLEPAGTPYLTAEEWGRVDAAVRECLREESEG